MSSDADSVARLDAAAREALEAVEALTGKGGSDQVGDETAQRLMLAGIRLFAHKTDNENRAFAPIPQGASITATEVAVAVTELMREVDLNMFDLAMWSGRARPPGDT